MFRGTILCNKKRLHGAVVLLVVKAQRLVNLISRETGYRFIALYEVNKGGSHDAGMRIGSGPSLRDTILHMPRACRPGTA